MNRRTPLAAGLALMAIALGQPPAAAAEELPEPQRADHGHEAPVREGSHLTCGIPAQEAPTVLLRGIERVAVEFPGLLELFRAQASNLHGG